MLSVRDRRSQRLLHCIIEGVEALRAVEREHAVAGSELDQDWIVLHSNLPQASLIDETKAIAISNH
jgi:hypothetical protein